MNNDSQLFDRLLSPSNGLLLLHDMKTSNLNFFNPSILLYKRIHHRLTNLLIPKSFRSSIPTTPSFNPERQQPTVETHIKHLDLLLSCYSLESLRKVHTLLVVSRLIEDHSLVIEVIRKYLTFGNPTLALSVFSTVDRPGLYLQNLAIRCFSDHGFYPELLDLYRWSQNSSYCCSDHFTFPSVIKACAAISSLRAGKEVHCMVLRTGYGGNVGVQTALLDMYAKAGQIGTSKKVFDNMSERDLISWNAMISSYSLNGCIHKAFEGLWQMQLTGLKANSSTIISIIPLCASPGAAEVGKSLHGLALKSGAFSDEALLPTLISMYAGLGDISSARLLFEMHPVKDLVAWNAMISSYGQHGEFEEGFELFKLMHFMGVRPNLVTLVSVLSFCVDLFNIYHGECIHAIAIKFGLAGQISVVAALVSMYAKLGKVASARYLFHGTPEKNLLLSNSMISGYLLNSEWSKALDIARRMQREGVAPDVVSMVSVISGCKSTKDLPLGRKLFDGLCFKSFVSWNAMMTGYRKSNLLNKVMILYRQMVMDGWKPNSVTLLNILPICESQMEGKSIHGYAVRNSFTSESSFLTSTMSMYARFDNIDYCCLLFKMVNERNVVGWNTIISACLQCKHAEEAITYFRKMLQMELEPDVFTILALISACSQLGSVDLGHCLTGFTLRKGFDSNISVANSLIDMHARCGSISFAKDLFEELKEKDSITWSVMINAYGMHGNGEAALNLFSMMEQIGLKPDDITFISILSACSHAGLVEHGRMLFNSMLQNHHIVPRMEHYACMVDLFGRTGHLDEAYDLVKKLPFKPSASLLESLLGACQCHGNTQIGEAIGELLIKSKQCAPSSYVMLSNIYAENEKWGDYERLRCDMELKGLKKDRGVSLIEVI
ncbi:pentatricopeptide repeat-containing protein At5g39350-like [Typha latifolia]|uniref:pentatricopeptide repeat-containing protein At5g39350-like n=1 Tax=Typha latifolia TaxID=4733 RepID=UPI003C2F6B20